MTRAPNFEPPSAGEPNRGDATRESSSADGPDSPLSFIRHLRAERQSWLRYAGRDDREAYEED